MTETLWDEPRRRGRARRGLDAEIQRARADGQDLPESKVAVLRSLADQVDRLDRILAASDKPYDRVALAQLVRQYDDTYSRVFAPVDASPFEQLLAALDDQPGSSHTAQ